MIHWSISYEAYDRGMALPEARVKMRTEGIQIPQGRQARGEEEKVPGLRFLFSCRRAFVIYLVIGLD